MPEPLLPCGICPERATVLYLCASSPRPCLRGARCSDHPLETCAECLIIGITTVVAGG